MLLLCQAGNGFDKINDLRNPRLNSAPIKRNEVYIVTPLPMMCQGNETGRGDVGEDQPVKGEWISAISVLEQ